MKAIASLLLCAALIISIPVLGSEPDVTSLVKPSAVYAEISKDTPLYAESNGRGGVKAKLGAGCMVEILQDYSTLWYRVRDDATGISGWLKNDCLIIPEDPETNTEKLTEKQMEDYVNAMEYSSGTKYLVFTDIDRQLTHVFRGEKGDWRMHKTFVCSTGKNVSPTTRGTYKASDRGLWFYSERFGSGAKYWVRFNGSYLFHSVAMDKNKNIIDDILGERRSSGCIRLSVDDAKWIYENIPAKTSVLVY